MVIRLSSLVAIFALIAGAALGQSKPQPDCALTDDQKNCTRLLACYGTSGLWFKGWAIGRGTGVLAGHRSDGVMCHGTWVSRNAVGLGQASVACDNGDTAEVFYTFQDEYTGTAIGRGLSRKGYLIKAWSGEHVLDYLHQSGMPEGTLVCGGEGNLIG